MKKWLLGMAYVCLLANAAFGTDAVKVQVSGYQGYTGTATLVFSDTDPKEATLYYKSWWGFKRSLSLRNGWVSRLRCLQFPSAVPFAVIEVMPGFRYQMPVIWDTNRQVEITPGGGITAHFDQLFRVGSKFDRGTVSTASEVLSLRGESGGYGIRMITEGIARDTALHFLRKDGYGSGYFGGRLHGNIQLCLGIRCPGSD